MILDMHRHPPLVAGPKGKPVDRLVVITTHVADGPEGQRTLAGGDAPGSSAPFSYCSPEGFRNPLRRIPVTHDLIQSLVAVLVLGLFSTAFAADAVRTLAGAAQVSAYADGPAASARFGDPVGLARDASGNLFIADSANQVVRRLAPDGTVTTVAGRPGEAGANDGSAATARFDTPSALVVAKDGTLFLSDAGNHTLRRRAPNGTVTTLAGFAGSPGSTNGLGAVARFNAPLGLALAPNGDLFVADSGNHAIRRITSAGNVTTFAGGLEQWGAADGKGDQARFNGPVGLVLDATGNLLVADSFNHAIRKIAPDGTVTTVAGQLGEDGFADGPAGDARFGAPAELAIDPNGNLYVTDGLYNTLRRIAPDGTVSTVAGLAGLEGSADGGYGSARFFNPYGLVATPTGSLIVSDTLNQVIREVVTPFTLSARRPANGPTVIRWESLAGRAYRVLVRDSLSAPWQPLGADLTATGAAAEATDDAAATVRFYQVERRD